MSGMAERRKRIASPSLLKILRFVMIMLIPMAVICILVGIYTYQKAEERSTERLDSTVSYHIEQLDRGYEQLTYYMTDALTNDENAIRLQSMRGTEVLAPYWITALTESLQPLQGLLGPGYSLYAAAPGRQLRCCIRSTLDDYTVNAAVQKYVEGRLASIPRTGFLQENVVIKGHLYFITACQRRGIYLACWIRVEQLFSFMDSVIQTDDGFYALVDESFSPILHAEAFTAAGITLGEDGQPKTLLDGVCCTLHWTGLGTGIVTVDRKDIRLGETAIYLGGILLLCGIAIGFCSYIIYYFRHYIEEPLQFFQNHVNDYLKERRFTKRYGFAELDEVENAFSALETQVEELKIDIYEEKLRRTRTELEFLQNQIKPHFFVNCFNIIIGMAEWERFDQIQDFCMLLSSYVRYTLCDGFETVSLKEELEQSRDFLEIQNIRFDTAATLCELSEEAGDASLEFAQVPPMTILSFVENSIKHNKFKVDDLKMQVSIRHIPGGLNGLWEILFADNGVGLDEAQCAGMREMLNSIREDVLGKGENVAFSGEQIGIQNVYRRMLLLFGERARMELVSNPGEGFAVKVTIPSIEKKTPAIKDK